METSDILGAVLHPLNNVLSERKQQFLNKAQSSDKPSYVVQLHQKGLNKILEKVGEEAFETVLAAKDCTDSNGQKDVIAETADLWFHTLVMLDHLNLSAEDVLRELANRFNISGIEEKASRQ